MNQPDRVSRLVEALNEHSDLSPENIAELMSGPGVTLDVHEVRRIHTSVTEARQHSYPPGVYGAPCSRCGSRQGWREQCVPPPTVTVDRGTLLALLELAEAAIESPHRQVADRLSRVVRRYVGNDRHCGCVAQDGDVCAAHRAVADHAALEQHLKSQNPEES